MQSQSALNRHSRPPVAKPLVAVLGLLAGLMAVSVHAAADWVWTDAAGRKVFSDMPPPASVPDKNIQKRPATANQLFLPAAATPSSSESSAAKEEKADKPAIDPAAEKKKRDAEQAEKPKSEAQEQRNAAIRADNCQRARSSLATLETGARLATTNAQGEQVVMDDAMRENEARRLQQAIQDNCR